MGMLILLISVSQVHRLITELLLGDCLNSCNTSTEVSVVVNACGLPELNLLNGYLPNLC